MKEEETSIDERQANSHLPSQLYGSQIADRLSFPIRHVGTPFAPPQQFFFPSLPSVPVLCLLPYVWPTPPPVSAVRILSPLFLLLLSLSLAPDEVVTFT